MIITLAFQKKPDDNIMSKIIGFLVKKITNSKYSHVECFFKSNGIFISSDITTGVIIKDLYELSDKYDYFDINVDGRKYKSVIEWVKSINKSEYDLKGIFLAQLFKIKSKKAHSKNKYFCSELVAIILNKFDIKLDKKPHLYSPESLYKELNAKNII